MAVYSISDLEKLSGIKAHTIRMWEKRYNIISPQRTPTNIRYYLDGDLKRILNIAILNRNGIKISRIAKMGISEIDAEAAHLANVEFSQDNLVDALTLALIELNEEKFSRIISSNIDQNGFEKTMIEVVYPLLNKLSMLWMTGSIKPVHENFMLTMIRQKVIVAIDKEQNTNTLSDDKFLLYMPEEETQELNFLFLQYLIVARKHRVINIGLNISTRDLEDAYALQQPKYIFTIISENRNIVLQTYLDQLAALFPKARILISGYQAVVQNIQPKENVTILSSMNETLAFMEELENSRPSTS